MNGGWGFIHVWKCAFQCDKRQVSIKKIWIRKAEVTNFVSAKVHTRGERNHLCKILMWYDSSADSRQSWRTNSHDLRLSRYVKMSQMFPEMQGSCLSVCVPPEALVSMWLWSLEGKLELPQQVWPRVMLWHLLPCLTMTASVCTVRSFIPTSKHYEGLCLPNSLSFLQDN